MAELPGVDLSALTSWLDAERPGLRQGQLSGEVLTGGKSNLTYRITDGTSSWALRRPPLAHVLPTAHDMAREFRVISALQGTEVPVAEAIALCTDPDVLGAQFYLMGFIDGVVLDQPAVLERIGSDEAARCCELLMDTLAALHEVAPASVGLAEFGRPEGFLERQLRRWHQQWMASVTADRPEYEPLIEALRAQRPEPSAPAIVHGDYRLTNVMFAPALDRIAAVVDWEMATLGDPLTDLGLLVVYQDLAQDENTVQPKLSRDRGFLTGAQMIDRYAATSPRDLTNLNWYIAFGYYKLAVISEGIHHRFLAGKTVGAGFSDMGAAVPVLLSAGRAALDSYEEKFVDFQHSEQSQRYQAEVASFLDEHIYPAEHRFEEQAAANRAAGTPFRTPAVLAELKTEARSRGLWNLFLPDAEHGAGLSVLDYAPIAELSGRSLAVAPEAMNCAAPDTGNMELLAMFATEAQSARWLQPLLEGEIRSCFSMTEPAVASSDATNIATTITADGDSFVVNGRKWWSTGAMRPECKVAIVMGVSDPDAGKYQRHSMILVPLDTPGVTLERSTTVYGYDDGPHGGHGVILYDNVRVPRENLLGPQGGGFMMAQARLGPGRIHHCMRSLGIAERALELMVARASSRTTFGQSIVKHGVVQEWIAESRIAIDQARLLVLNAAWKIDTVGASRARSEVASIKVAAPRAASYVLDRAVQVFGAAGVSSDTPLASGWAQLRTLHLADGPDEVHLRSVAREELRKQPVS